MLTMPPLGPISSLAPLVLRMVVGVVMAAHGYAKLIAGPSSFAETLTSVDRAIGLERPPRVAPGGPATAGSG